MDNSRKAEESYIIHTHIYIYAYVLQGQSRREAHALCTSEKGTLEAISTGRSRKRRIRMQTTLTPG